MIHSRIFKTLLGAWAASLGFGVFSAAVAQDSRCCMDDCSLDFQGAIEIVFIEEVTGYSCADGGAQASFVEADLLGKAVFQLDNGGFFVPEFGVWFEGLDLQPDYKTDRLPPCRDDAGVARSGQTGGVQGFGACRP